MDNPKLSDDNDKALESVLRMNSGDGPNSYAANSNAQSLAMVKARSILEESVKRVYTKTLSSTDHFAIADLGCATGPNSLKAASEIIEVITGLCSQAGKSTPEILVFLNDILGNDFNSIFVDLPDFYDKLKLEKKEDEWDRKCFVSAMPGSFYGKLFPSKSLHFVHSSMSVHWLSQVPEGLEDMKGNVFMAMASPPGVFKVYLKQFQKDFTTFLRCRADEIVAGGEMLLTLLGRSSASYSTTENCVIFELLSKSLLEMAHQGLVEEGDIDSLNLPHFKPSEEEVTDLVRQEGSFVVNSVELFEMNWDPLDDEDSEFDKERSGRNVASYIRAVMEPMLTAHFGEGVSMEDLFGRYSVRVGEHLAVEKTKHANLVISLTRRSV